MSDGEQAPGPARRLFEMSQKPLRRENFNVTMGDVDAAGILYFGAPLVWLDRLMGAWMREIGLPVSALLARGEGAPAVHTETDYRSPIGLDEPVEALLFHAGHGRSSYTLAAEFRHAVSGLLAVETRFTAVWVSRDASGDSVEMRSVELPEQLLSAF